MLMNCPQSNLTEYLNKNLRGAMATLIIIGLGLSACLRTTGGASRDTNSDTSGAGDTANQSETYEHTITVDDMEREFIVYVPAIVSNDDGVPVVFMFHGTTGNGEKFYNISGWREKADQEGLIAVFPSSLTYCFFEDENYDGDFDDRGEKKVTTKWTSGKLGDPEGFPLCSAEEIAKLAEDKKPLVDHPLVDDLNFISAILEFLVDNYPVDPNRFYITGFSNGGAFAGRLAAEMSDKFAAGASAAAGLQVDAAPVPHPMPFVLSIGDSDQGFTLLLRVETIPLEEDFINNPGYKSGFVDPYLTLLGLEDSYVYDELTISGVTVSHYSFTVDTRPEIGSHSLEILIIEGLEHSYPNGRNHPVTIVDYLWDFFKDKSLP